MKQAVRVVHYVNQFFGGLGGEERAQTPLEVREGPVGPGRALQQALGAEGTVVATLVCGDDYVAEREEAAGAGMRDALQRYQPDLVLAGPAFDSGRYGLGCALACRVARSLGIHAVTAMYPDNAAIITHRRELLAVPTGLNIAEMRDIVARMVALGLKVVRGEQLGPALEEGYIPHGVRTLVTKDRVGYERAVDMLLARVAGRPFVSEISVQQYERVTPAPPVADLSRATIGIVVSTGIVPRGNPDRLPGARALTAGRYSIDGLARLDVGDWESAHGGFNTKVLNTENPDYALPLATLRALEAEGVIGGVYPWIFSTVGNQTAVGPARAIGQLAAAEFRDAGVAVALQVSG
jgi:glycine reductase complex component B subunit gamma